MIYLFVVASVSMTAAAADPSVTTTLDPVAENGAASAPGTGGCPWAGIKSPTVTATMKSVSVNDVEYDVRGREARQDFEKVLKACGLPDAVDSFRAWRAARREVNVLAAVGPPLIVLGTFMPAYNIWPQLAIFSVGVVDMGVVTPAWAGAVPRPRRNALTQAIHNSSPPTP